MILMTGERSLDTYRRRNVMTIPELYAEIEEKYDEVFERIGNDAWIAKYLRKFVAEDYLDRLSDAVSAGDWENVFKNSHTIKGLALNLGLQRLSECSGELCEAVREGGAPDDPDGMFATVLAEYTRIASCIARLE